MIKMYKKSLPNITVKLGQVLILFTVKKVISDNEIQNSLIILQCTNVKDRVVLEKFWGKVYVRKNKDPHIHLLKL